MDKIQRPDTMSADVHPDVVADAPNNQLIKKQRTESMDQAFRHGRPRTESVDSVNSVDYHTMMFGGERKPRSSSVVSYSETPAPSRAPESATEESKQESQTAAAPKKVTPIPASASTLDPNSKPFNYAAAVRSAGSGLPAAPKVLKADPKGRSVEEVGAATPADGAKEGPAKKEKKVCSCLHSVASWELILFVQPVRSDRKNSRSGKGQRGKRPEKKEQEKKPDVKSPTEASPALTPTPTATTSAGPGPKRGWEKPDVKPIKPHVSPVKEPEAATPAKDTPKASKKQGGAIPPISPITRSVPTKGKGEKAGKDKGGKDKGGRERAPKASKPKTSEKKETDTSPPAPGPTWGTGSFAEVVRKEAPKPPPSPVKSAPVSEGIPTTQTPDSAPSWRTLRREDDGSRAAPSSRGWGRSR